MTKLTSKLLAKPWLVALSVALLGVAGFGGGWVLTHHHKSGIHVRVLGEQFKSSGGGAGAAGAAGQSRSAKPPTAGAGHGPTAKPPTSGAGASPDLSFTISANVSGLVLGRAATLPVQISNPNSNGGTLTVNSVTVTAQDITAANGDVVCAASNLQVTDYDSSQTGATVYAISTGSSATLPLPIFLEDSLTIDETACQGKTFSIHVSGTATVTHP